MKLTMLLPPEPDDSWTLAVQAGVTHAVTKVTALLSSPPTAKNLAKTREFDRDTLARVRRDFVDRGITLLGLEGDPFDLSRVKLGRPGREEDFVRYRDLLASMGELGLDLLCYNFMLRAPGAAHDWSRTRIDRPTRGGALTTEFVEADVPDRGRATPDEQPFTHETVWANYADFVRAVLPAAQAAGVRMALHPDDPPRPTLAGVPRIFGTPDAFDRAYSLAPSPANAVTFCQANFLLMPGDAAAHARRLSDRIAFVHWRDVVGTPDRFHETFHDDGPHDMAAFVRLYADLGFTGPIRLDHAPLMHGETEPWMPGYGTLGRLQAAAYLRGIAHALGVQLA